MGSPPRGLRLVVPTLLLGYSPPTLNRFRRYLPLVATGEFIMRMHAMRRPQAFDDVMQETSHTGEDGLLIDHFDFGFKCIVRLVCCPADK